MKGEPDDPELEPAECEGCGQVVEEAWMLRGGDCRDGYCATCRMMAGCDGP